ncbi:hypothetical protein SSPO_096160 [Streptomyces antimycoticus]|uniref:Uncharacterized protein n=1 Tax=Streptomyces antimycoticus TaxID=68175 RepID=A0A499V3D6_9ACTN|nr:hypothetical protein SSPO_096160 [Streptomyces antimycoticus]
MPTGGLPTGAVQRGISRVDSTRTGKDTRARRYGAPPWFRAGPVARLIPPSDARPAGRGASYEREPASAASFDVAVRARLP